MRILVTGAAGFIGGHLVERLLRDPAVTAVAALDGLIRTGRLANLAGPLDDPRCSFHRCDIRDGAALGAVMGAVRPDAVVHLAAETHVDVSIMDAAAFVTTNVLGTQALLDALRQIPADRAPLLVHMSSDEVFGDLADTEREAFDEEAPYRPSSPYAASKAAADHLVRAAARTHGLAVRIVHGANALGPRQYPEKLVPRLIERALRGMDLPVYGSGLQQRNWVAVEELCEGIALALLRGQGSGAWCLGGPDTLSNLDLVRALAGLMDARLGAAPGTHGARIVHVADRPGHDVRYRLDSTRAARDLGWRAATPALAALAATVDWHLQHRDWWRDTPV